MGDPGNSEMGRLIREVCRRPLGSRLRLCEGMMQSPTYLLQAGDQPLGDAEVRSVKGTGGLSVWAESDASLGGVWVPLFTGHEQASAYVSRQDLRPPEGRRFQWVRHEPGQVYEVLQGIPCFAGVWLDPGAQSRVRLDWAEVNALSERRLPADIPVLYTLPVDGYRLPEGTRCRIGHLDERVFGFQGRQVIFPEAGDLELQDFRKLVQVDLDEDETAWAPCRHFVAFLRRVVAGGKAGARRHEHALVQSLIAFEMYGEAEAFCSRLAGEDGRASYALAQLSLIFRRSGRLESCIEVCRNGLREHPAEPMLYRNLVLSHAQMENLEEAREVARRGLRWFPDDATLIRFV
ncbi:MAG: hypothetical protein ABII00_00710 [Elusimicrobiota bacterium]